MTTNDSDMGTFVARCKTHDSPIYAEMLEADKTGYYPVEIRGACECVANRRYTARVRVVREQGAE